MKDMASLTLTCISACAILLTGSCARQDEQTSKQNLPNILWITCEDMSPHLGCYGDSLAETPNLDRLAMEGVKFTHAFSVSGVCAPSRAALITGMYPTSFGAMHMRTTSRTSALDKITDPELLAIPVYEAVPPAEVRCFPEFLRELGYYCTNNKKNDYQFHAPLTAWDENGATAHYKNRPDGSPFFSVFNITTTHESQVWARANDTAITDPESVVVPPYYPDTKVVRKDLARMYDNIRIMDRQAGDLLAELHEAGLDRNTIVFFYSDHGDGTPRAKRWLYDSGIRVPLLIRFPDGDRAGETDDRLVSFVDFAPTVLNLAGIEIPGYMEGQPFLGNDLPEPRKYVFGARDRMDPATDRARFVRDEQFKYIKNYEPEKPFVQWIPYRDQMALMQELLKYHRLGLLDSTEQLWFRDNKPEEELYDTKNDPHEIRNLAGKPGYDAILEEMRTAHEIWKEEFGDLGAMPEPELVKQLWPPDGVQPVTSPVTFRFQHDSLILSSATPGASIAFQLPADTVGGKDHWRLFHQPFGPGDEKPFRAVAHRIGYKPARPVELSY